MNSIYISMVLWIALLPATATVHAQNGGDLRSSYSSLCATPEARKGETCVALGKALAEKAAGDAVLDKTIWGLYAELAGRTMAVGNPSDPIFAKVRYEFQGGKLKEHWTWYGADARASNETIVVEQLAGTSRLRLTNSAGTKWEGSALADGAVIFSKGTIVGKSEMGYYPTPSGPERRTYYRGKGVIEYLAPFDSDSEAGYIEIAAANRIEEQRRKQAAADARLQLVSGLISGAAQGYADYKAQAGTGVSEGTAFKQQTPPSLSSSSDAERTGVPRSERQRIASTDELPAKPLRFVLSIALMPAPGDRVNPTCYSNIITRPGPPGWGAASLPPGSEGTARQSIATLKRAFISACLASGRKITSEGDFSWAWNQFRDGEAQLENTGPKYPEDVSVSLN